MVTRTKKPLTIDEQADIVQGMLLTKDVLVYACASCASMDLINGSDVLLIMANIEARRLKEE